MRVRIKTYEELIKDGWYDTGNRFVSTQYTITKGMYKFLGTVMEMESYAPSLYHAKGWIFHPCMFSKEKRVRPLP